jgi:hypothetical protein
MNQIRVEPAPANVRRVGQVAQLAGIALALAAMIGLGAWLVRSPDFVDRVVVVNRTPDNLDVDVSGGDRDGWTPISVASGQSSTTTKDVVDQGDTWIFRFTREGVVGGELEVARSRLAENGWRVVVPDRVMEELRAADSNSGT